MDVFQNMELFSEMIRCGGDIYTWCYDADGKLLQSNCPDAGFLSGAFDLFGCRQKMLDYGRQHTKPVTLGTALGMTWAAAFEKDGGTLKRAWVIGPVFYQDVSLRGIEHGLQYYSRLEVSVAWTMQLYEVLKTVPVLQCTILNRYTLMLHYCLCGEHLALSDINSDVPAKPAKAPQNPAHDRHKVWMAEQGLLQMVRTGELGNQNPGNGTHRAHHHRKYQRKIAAKPHRRNVDLAQLPDHNLIDNGKGRLQHTLQGHRHGNFAQRFHKV